MKKWLRRIVQGILLMVMAFSIVEIGSYLWARQHSNSQLSRINKQLSDLAVPTAFSTGASGSKQEELVDYTALMKRLKEMNKDTVAYLTIFGSENRYPVLQAKDNDYYLRRGIDEEYSIQGIPFMDFQNKPDLSDQNTVLYGHMMYYGDEMFGILKHFLDQSYTDKSEKRFTLTNEKGVYTYRIFSIRQPLATDPYRYPNLEEEKFLANLQQALTQSETNFHFDSVLSAKDHVVTLSTCTANQDDEKRIAVVGVLEKIQTKERTITREEVIDKQGKGSWEKTGMFPVPQTDASSASEGTNAEDNEAGKGETE